MQVPMMQQMLKMTTTRHSGTRCVHAAAIGLCLALLLAGCANRLPQRQHGSSPVLLERGQASWYGGKFHGRRTASGERFDRKAFTAAHRTLPFGTRLCVRSAASGKTVVVRVNDRGPFSKNRVIDLSESAARSLGMLKAGLAKVELWRIGEGGTCPRNLP